MKAITRSKGVTDTERVLARLCDQTFLDLWSYPSLYTSEGRKGDKGVGKELCDMLVVFGSDLLIFSDKDISFNAEIDVTIAWPRWRRKSIDESKSQLYGAYKWLKEHPGKLYFDPQCQKPFPFIEPGTDYRIHLIAVTKNTQKAAAELFGMNSSGSFILYSVDADEIDDHPFSVLDDRSKPYVHVFDEVTLELVLRELDTAPDFIKYLKVKEDAIRRGRIRVITGEEELLAVYMKQGGPMVDKPFAEYEKAAPAEFEIIQIPEGEWADYVNSGARARLKQLHKGSYFWDELISRFTKAILTATAPNPLNASVNMHETAVRMLASETRFTRGQLAKEYQAKIRGTPSHVRTSKIFRSPITPHACIILVIIPQDVGQTSDEYRARRLDLLYAYGLVAKLKMPDLTIFTMIGTEPGGSELRSEDVLALKIEKLGPEEVAQAQTLMKDGKILSHVWHEKPAGNAVISAFKAPKKNTTYRNKMFTPGRNDPCPCNSGLKFKKCCFGRNEDIGVLYGLAKPR
ncbi:YecA family protein [Rhodoferax ferrireducens]|nr:SEC-C metal-binding domain-containing protein [Rhodoferax ferrireducens]